jgi:hypothetical protein
VFSEVFSVSDRVPLVPMWYLMSGRYCLQVQSRQSGRQVSALNFQASLAAKDLQVSSESNPRLHSSSSTISHHLRFNHLNYHENKEDGLGSENAETSGLQSSSRKPVMVRGSLINEAVNGDISGEGISSIGSELENVPSTVSTNEIGGSTSESGLGPSSMTSERIMSDSEVEISPQGTSSTTVMTSERSDASQSSLTSVFSNSSTASSVIVEPMPDPIPTTTDVPIFSGPHGEAGGSILHDDMMSIFSNDGVGRSIDSSSSETRRSHRRILWDAFSRRGSRGYPESDADEMGFFSTWLDLGDDIFEELGESRYFHRRRHGSIRVSQYSRSRVIVIPVLSCIFSVMDFAGPSHGHNLILLCYRLGSIAVLFLIVVMNKTLLHVLWGFIKLADAPVILSLLLKNLAPEQVYQELSC